MANAHYKLEEIADMHELVIFDTSSLFNIGVRISGCIGENYFNTSEVKRMSSNFSKFSKFYEIMKEKDEICTIPEVIEEFQDMVCAARKAYGRSLGFREDRILSTCPQKKGMAMFNKKLKLIKKLGLKIVDIDVELKRRQFRTNPEIYTRVLDLVNFSAKNYVKHLTGRVDCLPDPNGTDEALLAAAYACAIQRIGSAAVITNDKRIGYVAKGLKKVFGGMLADESGKFSGYNSLDAFMDFTPRLYTFNSLRDIHEPHDGSFGHPIPEQKLEEGIKLVGKIEEVAPERRYNFSNVSVEKK